MNDIRKIFLFTYKDLLSEFRSREAITTMIVFSMLVVAIFNFTFETGSAVISEAAPGIIWIAVTFSGMIGLNRSFVYEVDKGCLQGLLLIPMDRGVIYLGKMLGNFVFITITELVSLPLFIVFFNLDFAAGIWHFLLILALANLGLSAVGTLFSAMAVNTKTRDVMLPILLFPIFVPVLMAAVSGTGEILRMGQNSEIPGWQFLIVTLVAFDMIFVTLCYLLFDYVMEE